MQKNELDVFVARQTLLFFVLDVEFKNLLHISLDSLTIWVFLVSLHDNGEKGGKVQNCLFHANLIDEQL